MPSAHVYLQLEPGQSLRDVPRALLQDATQLCKANSAQGNKVASVVVIYTLGSNLLKTRHMKPGELGFINERRVRKVLVAKQDDKIMDRLNRTKEKVLSAKSEREKEQQARERQRQKAEAKQHKKMKRQQQKKQEQGIEAPTENSNREEKLEPAWGTEPEKLPLARNKGRIGRRQRREWREEDDSDASEEEHEEKEETSMGAAVTSRCFPVGADQRKVLQGCRALVERKFEVRVEPPRKGLTEGKGNGHPRTWSTLWPS